MRRKGMCRHGRQVSLCVYFILRLLRAGFRDRRLRSWPFGAKGFRPAVFAPAARSCSPANRQQWQSRLAEALRQLSSLLGRLQPWLGRGPGTAAPQRSIQ